MPVSWGRARNLTPCPLAVIWLARPRPVTENLLGTGGHLRLVRFVHLTLGGGIFRIPVTLTAR